MSKTIEVSEETYERIKEQLGEEERLDVNSYDDLIGKKLFIRTVTYHLVGKVANLFNKFLKLEKASWVADSGRFSNAIKEGKLDEVEPVGEVFVNVDAITDFFPWKHDLPKNQK